MVMASPESETELILIPYPAMGHVGAILEFTNLLIARSQNLSITVVVIKLPDYIDSVSGNFVDSVSGDAHETRLRYLHLPATEPEPEWSSRSRGHFVFRLIQSQRENLRDLLRRRSRRPAGVVVDMLMTPLMEVAGEFGIPGYVFFTSGVAFLGLMLHFQILLDEKGKDVTEFANSETELSFPSYAIPVPAGVLPKVLVDRDPWFTRFLHFARGYRKANGIIVNSFEGLESHAIASYRRTTVEPPLPPLYTVGPILNQASGKSPEWGWLMEWLDKQPPESVIFVCFGSQGSLPEDQAREIAKGLKLSGYRFLWSLRRPPEKDSETSKAQFPGEYSDYSEILPAEFLENSVKNGKGKVVGWVPQIDILSHKSIGGFVSHCGWNSILESIWCGVPIATWPVHSEQQVNAFQLVTELGMAAEITLEYCERTVAGDGVIVTAEMIEKGIKRVMEKESEVRKKVKEMQKLSRKACENGSSFSALLAQLTN